MSDERAEPTSIRQWVNEQVRIGNIPMSATIRFDGILSLARRSHSELFAITRPSEDRGWFPSDLGHFARTLVRDHRFAAALVRVLVEADVASRSDDMDVESATWVEAREALWRMRDAVTSALTVPTLRSALRVRCGVWSRYDAQTPTDAHLDGALQAVTPPVLRMIVTPETRIDETGQDNIAQAIWDDFDARGDDDSQAALCAVHDESALSRWSVRAGVSYRVARILIEAESRLRDQYAAEFPTMI